MMTEAHFKQMMKDGWFPFVELLGWKYEALGEAYRDRFDFESKVGEVVGIFGRATLERTAGTGPFSGTK